MTGVPSRHLHHAVAVEDGRRDEAAEKVPEEIEGGEGPYGTLYA
jgi:hypothetical protein